MLFPSLNIKAIYEAIKEYFTGGKKTEFKQKDERFKKNAKKLLDYYSGNQEEYLKNMGFEDKETGAELIKKMTLNVTKKIIDKISMVYKYPPERILINKEGDDLPGEKSGEYTKWINYVENFDNYISEGERRKNLFHKVLWRTHYRPERKKWDFLIEWDYVPHFLSGDPLNPIAYSVPVYIADANLKAADKVSGSEQIYLYYDDERYFYWNTQGRTWTYYVDAKGNMVDTGGKNDYKVSPFVELRKGIPVFEYDAWGAKDLISANESINMNLNNLNMALHYQAFGILWDNTGITGDEAKNVFSGPSRIYHLPKETTMSNLDLNPKLIEMIETIKFEVQAIANTYNLTVNWHQEATPVSGFSLIVQNMDYLEQRQKDVDEAVMQENRIFRTIVAQQQYYSKRGELEKDEPIIPTDADLRIDFSELDLPINQAEDIQIKEFKLKNNIINALDLIKEDNPDMDDENALKKLNENKMYNKQLGTADLLRQRIEQMGGQVAGQTNQQ